MSNRKHDFELVLYVERSEEQFLDGIADQLIEAGCDDATFSVRYGVPHAEFHSKAESFPRAVIAAIADVESVPGVRVERVEFDELLTATAIAERIGRTRQSVQQLISGKRGPGGFPPPAEWVVGTKVWEWLKVAGWVRETLGIEQLRASEDADFVAALNGVLQVRAHLDHLERAEDKEAISELAFAALNQRGDAPGSGA